jgi:DNA-binding PadR family transcriptional regulator
MKETGLHSGTLYPLLMRMTDQGLVEAEWREPSQPGRPARHAYRLTAQGRAVAPGPAEDSDRLIGSRRSLA